ncbi:exopolysaccharide biosynthesis protein [Magnetospirillum sp. SS-4]|uniref:exopolysaccharide biosynthesis protein n=1 Tax=Magnetospirillum sp. SS-4 TaxID=2681465 RepID=UPI00137DAC69|nr:exopolysaccharide biosynthesis protein [Magnetospirillum sp. SS-4]CAA7622102.1 Exopolysaccharide synthesis, ExoD [Magnetospirillum sp. SS-4]
MTSPRSLALCLSRLRRLGGPSGPTLAEAGHLLAERSTLLVMLLMAALALIPSPGVPLGVVTGLGITWLALSSLRDGQARLPASLSNRPLPRPLLEAALRLLVPLLRRVERRTRPRLPHLVVGMGGAVALMGIGLQGLLLALPLPFGNLPPAAAILALSAGLLWRDGLGVLAGHVLSLASLGVIGGLAWLAYSLVG